MRLEHRPQLHAAVGVLRGRGFSHQHTLGGKWAAVGHYLHRADYPQGERLINTSMRGRGWTQPAEMADGK